MSQFNGKKGPCPECKENGRDSSGDNLRYRTDGSAYCFSCSKNFTASALNGEPATEDVDPIEKDMLSTMHGLPIATGVPNVSDSVLSKYGVRAKFDTVTGVQDSLAYPYTQGGAGTEVTGYKVRKFPKDFYAQGRIQGLFGQNTMPKNPKGQAVLVEGEKDALVLATFFETLGKNIDVFSVPFGASTNRKSDFCVDRVAQYATVLLMFDDDPPGELLLDQAAQLLCTEVRTLKVPPSTPRLYKDAAEFIENSAQTELWDYLKTFVEYSPEGIVAGTDIDLNTLLVPHAEGAEVPFPILQERLRGIRKGEITTVCAASGIGKTTLVKELAFSLVKDHGMSVCHIALEDLVETTVLSYLGMNSNVPGMVLRTNPSAVPRSELEKSKKEITDKMFFYRHFGSLSSELLLKTMEYYVNMRDVDYIVLDHLSMVVSGSESSNERKSIDIIMTRLAELVVRTGVGLIQVVHLRRSNNDKASSLNEGGQVSLDMLRGSAGLEQMSWTVLGLERDQQAQNGKEDYLKLRLLKNRTWGYTGECDTLKYNHTTGRLEPVTLTPTSTPGAVADTLSGMAQAQDTGAQDDHG